MAYNGIEPNTTDCIVGNDVLLCTGRGVLRDGDIGPTHSVDVSDPDQVRRFFVWHRDNGTVTLLFSMADFASFSVSYIDIYTLSVPSDRIGLPTFSAMGASVLGTQRCSSSSSPNAVSRTTFSLSVTDAIELIVSFQFTSQDIDWLFISEIRLCGGTPPSSPISCDTPTPRPSEPTEDTETIHYPTGKLLIIDKAVTQICSFFGKVTALGVLCCFALFVCLFDLAYLVIHVQYYIVIVNTQIE